MLLAGLLLPALLATLLAALLLLTTLLIGILILAHCISFHGKRPSRASNNAGATKVFQYPVGSHTAEPEAGTRVSLPVTTKTGARTMGRYLLLWLLGIPLPILLLIWLFGGLH